MTYKELQDAVIRFRFNEGRRADVKDWIGLRYGEVWSAADWPFKYVHREDLTVSAGTATAPSALRRPLQLENAAGDMLEYLSQSEFRDLYAWDDTTSSTADVYTLINSTFYIEPADTGTFKLSYERRPSHLADGTTDTAGLMNSDNDTPIWPVEHHYLLVVGAMSTGLKLENDNTWPALEDEFTRLVEVMKEDLLPPVRGQTLQYGRDEAF